MNDPYVIYYLLLSLAVVSVNVYLAYRSYWLGRIAAGITRNFLYSLANLRVAIISVELFWFGLIFLPLIIPPEWRALPSYRLTVTAIWTLSQVALAWASYYTWRTLHRKE